ncbi:MAG: restriction endonuclease [Edaphobacter sp.]
MQTEVERQLHPLVRRKAQLVRKDEYGILQVERWEKEKNHFIKQNIEPSLDPSERSALQREHKRIANLIDACVELATQNQPAFQRFSDDMTPPEFEVFCAEELSRAGWNAHVTKQSGDQGTDVVAEKGEMRVVVQCKLYSQPVGNKSVQEIAAAKAHYQARYGVVVTNNRYTLAAEQLASTNKILLLHWRDLENLHNLLSKE